MRMFFSPSVVYKRKKKRKVDKAKSSRKIPSSKKQIVF